MALWWKGDKRVKKLKSKTWEQLPSSLPLHIGFTLFSPQSFFNLSTVLKCSHFLPPAPQCVLSLFILFLVFNSVLWCKSNSINWFFKHQIMELGRLISLNTPMKKRNQMTHMPIKGYEEACIRIVLEPTVADSALQQSRERIHTFP